MSQLRDRNDELKQAGIRVCIVTFDSVAMAETYLRQQQLDWPLLIDSQRELYRAYAFQSGSWWSIYNPKSIWLYLKLIFAGNRVHEPGADFRQFGGNILIDPQGIVRLHYVSNSPHDRPAVNDILAAAKLAID